MMSRKACDANLLKISEASHNGLRISAGGRAIARLTMQFMLELASCKRTTNSQAKGAQGQNLPLG